MGTVLFVSTRDPGGSRNTGTVGRWNPPSSAVATPFISRVALFGTLFCQSGGLSGRPECPQQNEAAGKASHPEKVLCESLVARDEQMTAWPIAWTDDSFPSLVARETARPRAGR